MDGLVCPAMILARSIFPQSLSLDSYSNIHGYRFLSIWYREHHGNILYNCPDTEHTIITLFALVKLSPTDPAFDDSINTVISSSELN